MKMLKFYTLLALLLMVFTAKAQDAEITAEDTLDNMEVEAEEAPQSISEKLGLPFEIGGFADVYYIGGFNGHPFPTSFTEEVKSFSLGMANLTFSKDDSKVGFMIDLGFGPRAEVANGFPGTTLAAIKQLYITYSPANWVTFTMGNYGTHVGYELIDSPDNINYSTSYMFSNGPFYHTGLKADFAISETVGAMIGVF